MDTMADILEDVGFERWDEVDQKKLSTLVHNVAAGMDNVAASADASRLVTNTFLRCCNMWLERSD